MSNSIPNELINQLAKDHEEIIRFLFKKKYEIQSLPNNFKAKKHEGEAFALAYPIQGVLKYHGLFNAEHRIAYFPSISFNNDCAYTVSYLKFDKNLKRDVAFLDGQQVFDDRLDRISHSLNHIREYSNIRTKAILISRNFLNTNNKGEMGKGLGTSASGSSALALAAASIIYDNDPKYIENKSLISVFSRYLSGSGCRSALGGFSLWLSHPKINPLDSFAIKLNKKEHDSFMDDISLLTIPVKSELKTAQAHEIAPKSLFLLSWLKNRKKLVLEFIEALDNLDFNKIGELAEFDTLCLHSVAMTAPHEQKIIAWEPVTLKIMHHINKLQREGHNVYYSIDTGPSVVLLTQKSEKDEIMNEMKSLVPEYEVISGKIGSPSKLLTPNSQEAKKLEEDINKFVSL
jgi:diphosphomevalonate decarboxylase